MCFKVPAKWSTELDPLILQGIVSYIESLCMYVAQAAYVNLNTYAAGSDPQDLLHSITKHINSSLDVFLLEMDSSSLKNLSNSSTKIFSFEMMSKCS